mmetsp:Transcript_15860/g.28344  ORF Transcript_15860/g.28344 Transcript_15860/m.28344 type:complete len:81 (+) Transcript_15860:182-424(+)
MCSAEDVEHPVQIWTVPFQPVYRIFPVVVRLTWLLMGNLVTGFAPVAETTSSPKTRHADVVELPTQIHKGTWQPSQQASV